MDFNIPLLTAFIGSIIASIYDLKTTEVPDEIPLIMILIGVSFYSFQTIFTNNIVFLKTSLIAGISLLAFGILMYYSGQWGGADALILSALGFLLPFTPKNFKKTVFPFPLTYLLNSFFVGAVYLISYALIVSFRNKKIVKKFLVEIKGGMRNILFFSTITFFVLSGLSIFISSSYFNISIKTFLYPLIVTLLTILFFIIIQFAKCVEKVGFRKRIPVSKLKVGDILLSFKQLRGIKREEIREIKKSGKKYVWIKFGIPYAPTFPLTLIFTLYFGDFYFYLNLFF